MINGIKNITEYDKKKFIDKLIVIFDTISLNKNTKKPIDIAKNKTLKKFSFL